MIEYQGKEYPTRTIKEIPEYGYDLVIATHELQNQLCDGNGIEKNREAMHLDNEIFWYASPEEFAMNGEELIKYILEIL